MHLYTGVCHSLFPPGSFDLDPWRLKAKELLESKKKNTLNDCGALCLGLMPNLRRDTSQSHKEGENREKQMNASTIKKSLN